MRGSQIGLFWILVCAFSLPIHAQTAKQSQSTRRVPANRPDDQQVRVNAALEMVRLISRREDFENTIRQVTAPMLEQAGRDAQQRGKPLPPDYGPKFQRAMAASLNYDEVMQWTAMAYAKRMTLNELRQVAAFFRTPAGHKYTQVAPEASGEMMRTMFTTLPKRMEEALKREGLTPSDPDR
jgi:hypothetical protein